MMHGMRRSGTSETNGIHHIEEFECCDFNTFESIYGAGWSVIGAAMIPQYGGDWTSVSCTGGTTLIGGGCGARGAPHKQAAPGGRTRPLALMADPPWL